MSKVLFVSIHHRRSPLFEEGIKLLLNDGFPVFILNTGLEKGIINLSHPNLDYLDLKQHLNYDQGVEKLGEILKFKDWDIVHFLDSDLFITDINYIKKTLKDFEDSPFGFASYFENGYGNDYHKYEFKNTLAEVTDQKFIDEYPFMSPSWENAAMMFKRDVWNQITDYSDMKYWLPELHRKGVRMAVKAAEQRLKFTHKGVGFVHIGNLTQYYYKVENGEKIEVDEISKPRIGYFQKYFNLQGYPNFTKEWGELIK